jgi:hypothetical protein
LSAIRIVKTDMLSKTRPKNGVVRSRITDGTATVSTVIVVADAAMPYSGSAR